MTNDKLNQNNYNIVAEYKEKIKNKQQDAYMLTISRDGESPERSVYFFTNAVEAVESYNKYQDWGFAKNFLTVTLYEPNGKIESKILKRPKAGESTFIRKDYIKAGKILKNIKKYLPQDIYINLINDFSELFSKDNQRFYPERFFKDLITDSEYSIK